MEQKDILDGIKAIGENVDQYKVELAELKKHNLELADDVTNLKKRAGKISVGSNGSVPTYESIIRTMLEEKYEHIRGLKEWEPFRIGNAPREQLKAMFDALSYGDTKNLSLSAGGEVKNMITSTALTGSIYANNQISIPIRPYFSTHLRDVIPIYQSISGSVIYPQEASSLTSAGS